MKPENQFLLLFSLLFLMILGWYLHSLSYNGWKQNPTPRKWESYEQYIERVSTDSVLRPFVDEKYPDSLQWRAEPITEETFYP